MKKLGIDRNYLNSMIQYRNLLLELMEIIQDSDSVQTDGETIIALSFLLGSIIATHDPSEQKIKTTGMSIGELVTSAAFETRKIMRWQAERAGETEPTDEELATVEKAVETVLDSILNGNPK